MTLRLLLPVALFAITAQAAAAQNTIERIRSTHQLRCGIVRQDAEYTTADDHGSRGAFDDELCRAMAVAVLGPDLRPGRELRIATFLDDRSAMDALRAGSLDVIATVSLDLSHLTAPGIALSPPVFIDSLALIVRRSSHLHHASQLSGRKVCFLSQTEAEDSLRHWFAQQHLDLLPFPFQEEGEMEAAYASHNCAAIASERTRLAGLRASFGSAAQQHIILPETLAIDPMASATSTADLRWTNLIATVIEVLLNAEALHITQHSTPENLTALQQRLLGTTGELGFALGLRSSWPADVVHAVGNYAELFNRTLGQSGSTTKRGPNRLATQGGMLIPLPLK